MINGTWIKDRIGISCIAYRVSKQTANPQLFVRRPANVRYPGGISVVIVGTRILRIEAVAGDRIIEIGDFAVALAPFTERVVRSALSRNHRAWSSGSLFREDLNNS